MNRPASFSEVIEIWPSVAAFASDVGAKYPTAAAWKQRNSIPPAKWRVVIVAAKKRGRTLSLDLLQSLAEQSFAAAE